MNQTINFRNLGTNRLVESLLSTIESSLDNFPHSEEFKDVMGIKKNENQHSLSFCLFMTNKCKSNFYFARENAQKGSNVVDIGIYRGSNLIFTIEAKILPTPKGTSARPRNDYEYVYGKGGGIQRFKDGKHGLDNYNNLLPENGMIAYITENTYAFWYKKINSWILDAGWPDKEYLLVSNSPNRFVSQHVLNTGSKVKLHHFWVEVSDK